MVLKHQANASQPGPHPQQKSLLFQFREEESQVKGRNGLKHQQNGGAEIQVPSHRRPMSCLCFGVTASTPPHLPGVFKGDICFKGPKDASVQRERRLSELSCEPPQLRVTIQYETTFLHVQGSTMNTA